MAGKLRNVLIGWGKRLGLLPTSVAEKALSELRLRKCKMCPHAQPKRILQIIYGNGDYVEQFACEKCGCPVVEKTLVVEESCPIGRW